MSLLKATKYVLILALMASTLCMPLPVNAIGLTIKRVIFEGPKRAEVITVINRSSKEKTYRMIWTQEVMNEDGRLEQVEEDDPRVRKASDMVRHSPRRMTLAPGAVQRVRLLLRRPGNLESGEYRSRFSITPEPEAEDFDDRDANAARDTLSITVSSLVGMSVPVIVRHGKMEAEIKISDVTITKKFETGAKGYFYLNRTGNRSVVGDMLLHCLADGKEPNLVKASRGIAIYTEIEKRKVPFSFDFPPGKIAACPKLEISFKSLNDDFLFKGDILDTQTISLTE